MFERYSTEGEMEGEEVGVGGRERQKEGERNVRGREGKTERGREKRCGLKGGIC